MNITPENPLIELTDTDSLIDRFCFYHCPDVDKKYVEQLKLSIKGIYSGNNYED